MAGARNHFVRTISDSERPELGPLLDEVELPRGRVLFEPGDAVQYVYFPETCVVSVIQPFASGDSVETATIGCEGVVCLSAALGGTQATARHLTQIGGTATRMRREDFIRAFDRLPGFHDLVLRYVRGFVEVALLSVACNRVHTVDRRLARWLLMTRDRNDSDVLPLTHDLLGEMLGVYRPTVTVAIRKLRRAGVIDTRPGEITIQDRAGLADLACECYRLTARALPANCQAAVQAAEPK